MPFLGTLRQKTFNTIDKEEDIKDFIELIEKKHKEFNDTLVEIAEPKISKKKSNQILSIKNIILYGIAGVGKTHNTNKLISLIEEENSERRRFTFLKMKPNASLINYSKAKKIFENLNQYILNTYGDIEGFKKAIDVIKEVKS